MALLDMDLATSTFANVGFDVKFTGIHSVSDSISDTDNGIVKIVKPLSFYLEFYLDDEETDDTYLAASTDQRDMESCSCIIINDNVNSETSPTSPASSGQSLQDAFIRFKNTKQVSKRMHISHLSCVSNIL